MPRQPFLRPIATVIFLAVGSFLSAADPKPNALTEKEIADGWIMLFDGESTFGWTGKAEVKGGSLQFPKGESIHFSIPLPPGTIVQAPGHGIVGNLELLTLDGKGKAISRSIGSNSEARTDIETAFRLGLTSGPVFFMKYQPAKPESIFNGKDLAGWKVFKDEKRAKSTWDVTAAGELALKNGPGDLQTEKQYDNFLLQLECKTNGAALNSGVFFRCIADQYQNGYEMQIQNAYKEGDRTKPADFGTGAIYRRVPARKVVSNDKEWFAMTLLAHGPNIATWVNGYPVLSWKDERAPNENPRQGLRTAKGHLSIQGHDPTTDLLFRNIRIVNVK